MRRFALFSLAVLGINVLVGCGPGGPALGTVEGTVTLDGAPLPEASIVFEPLEGRSSHGETDSTGKYELQYTEERPGALIGTHTVKVSTGKTVQSKDGSDKVVAEKVPSKYNVQTTMEQEVKSGSNTIDLQLDSDGEVVEPGSGNQTKDPSAC
jgi:hypothetical protein